MATRTPIKSPASPEVTYSNVWNGHPRKFKNVLFQVTTFILMMELAERVSYFGIGQGLKNFMQKIGWSLVSASALKSTWSSICFLSPLLGAYLADEVWGRFRTILTMGIWYCVGDFLVAIAAYPSIMDNDAVVNPIFVIGLFAGIGVATGCIKANAITLGADQFDPHDPREIKQKETFLVYFYWIVNIGALVSYGYLSILSVDGSSLIPAEYGYFATYMICAVIMAISIVILVIGKPRYVHVPPTDRTLSTLVKIAWSNSRRTRRGAVLVWGSLSFILAIVVNILAAFTTDSGKIGNVFAFIAGALVLVGVISWVYVGQDLSFLDESKLGNGGEFEDVRVNDFQSLVRILPYAALTIIWQCAYDQTDSNYQSITQQTDLRLDRSDPNSSQIPGSMLTVFNPIVIVICIPILDSVLYPLYKKVTGREPTPFGKVVVGLGVAAVGLLWTGIFEIIRRNAGPLLDAEGNYILDGGTDQPMNNISWGAAVPNYVFIAVAECLVNVTGYDIFYSEVPLSLKSTSQALNMFMNSPGNILTSVFTIMFSGYLPTDNLNDGHLEYMLFTIAGLSVVNIVAFVYFMKKLDLAQVPPSERYVEGIQHEKLSMLPRPSAVLNK